MHSPSGDATMPAPIAPVDEILPARKLVLLGLQHVLVMAASPITSVFLVARALNFSPALTLNLISATFLVCGIGTLLQSFGPLKFGAKLPFIMVPGGAPVIIFLTTAQQTNIQTAVGAVILTGLFYFLILPVFARGLRFFPKLVIGTMLLLVAINLVKVYGGIITGAPNSPTFGSPINVLLALATVGFTLLFARVLSGILGQLSVLFGLLAGAIVAALTGAMNFDAVLPGGLLSVPTLFPFGMPQFDIVAAIPLLVFSVISMAEATGQTVAIAEAVDKDIDVRTEVPKTIRGDALISLLGACLGTSLIITSGENIGVVRATGVRSRYVTASSGVILILLALFAPLGRLINAIPGPVVGGTADHRVLHHRRDGHRSASQGRSAQPRQSVYARCRPHHGSAADPGERPLQQVSILREHGARQRPCRRHHYRGAAQYRIQSSRTQQRT